MKQLLNPQQIAAAVVYSLMGVAVFWASFVAVDKITPYNLWQEIVQKQNRALAQVVGSIAVGISIIVAAAILG